MLLKLFTFNSVRVVVLGSVLVNGTGALEQGIILFFVFFFLRGKSTDQFQDARYRRSNSSLTPNGKKAGSAGGNAVSFWEPHLGWWYDWNPEQSSNHDTEYVPMLWGDGHTSHQDAQRYQEFQKLNTTPKYVLGFNEPDCSPPDSSSIDEDRGAQVWNDLIAPWGQKGALLGSPAMCSESI